MSDGPQLAPDLAQALSCFTRSLMAASRHWTLYPADHPAVAQSVGRLHEAVRELASHGMLSILLSLVAAAAPERRNGEPAQIWTESGHSSVVLRHIDYKKALERAAGGPLGIDTLQYL